MIATPETAATAPIKCYSYIRWSTPDQVHGDSERRQLEKARNWVAAQGPGYVLEEADVFKDDGTSAFWGKNATEGALREFRNRLEAGIIPRGSLLLIENTDRLTRLPAWEASQLLGSLVSAGAAVVNLSKTPATIYSREILTKDPYAFLMFVLDAHRGHEESARKSDMLKGKWADKRKNAADKRMTSLGPAWLEAQPDGGWKMLENQADKVRKVWTLAAAGLAPLTIAKRLNEAGVLPLRGARWDRQGVLRLLESDAVAGTLKTHTLERIEDPETGKRRKVRMETGTVVKDYYPRIVDDALFQDVRAKAKTKIPRGRHAGRTVQNIFSGVLHCETCGAVFTRNTTRGDYSYLVCSKAKLKACPGRYRTASYPSVERLFLGRLPELVAEAPPGEAGTGLDGEITGREEQLREVGEALYNIRRQIERGGFTPMLGTWLREREAEQAALKAQVGDLTARRAATQGALVERRMRDLCEAARAEEIDRGKINTLMRQVFSRITFGRGSGSMRIEWRHGGGSVAGVFWPEDDPFA